MKCIDWQKISYALIFFIFVLYIVSSLGFIIGININLWYTIFAILSSFFFLFFSSDDKRSFFSSTILFCVIVAGSLFLATSLYDYSFDGQLYHQIAIFYLKNGWNPIYQNMSDLGSLKDFLVTEIWIEHYSKAFEIVGSNFYMFTDRIESGKTQNLILFIAVFMYGYYALKSWNEGGGVRPLFFSFCFVCSPIVMSQIWTNYLDGFLSLLFLLSLFAILMIERSDRKIDFAVFGIALVLLSGTKLSGFVYAGLIGTCYFAFRILYKKRNKQIFTIGVTAFFLIVLSNINPWITNLAKGEHIFYPLMGKNKVDIITLNTTKEFVQKNRIEQFFISIFSKTQNEDFAEKNPSLKLPFTTDESEEHLSIPDTRIGGFGFLFSGFIVFVFLICLFGIKTIKKDEARLFVLFFLIITATILINPAPWWARYVPQVWFLPLFALFFFTKKRLLIAMGFILALTNSIEAFSLSSGVALIYTYSFKAIDNTLVDRRIEIRPLADVEKSWIIKFKEMGIDIAEKKNAPQEWSVFIKEVLQTQCGLSEQKISPIKKLKLLFDCSQTNSKIT